MSTINDQITTLINSVEDLTNSVNIKKTELDDYIILAANSANESMNYAILANNSILEVQTYSISASNSAIQAANSANNSYNSAIQSSNYAALSANSASNAANSASNAANTYNNILAIANTIVVYPSIANNAYKVLSVSSDSSNVVWSSVSNLIDTTIGNNSWRTINTIQTANSITSYTISNTDLTGNKIVIINAVSNVSVIIPENLTGTQPVTFIQANTGNVSFSNSTANVSILSYNNKVTLSGKEAWATIIPCGNNVFRLGGNLS